MDNIYFIIIVGIIIFEYFLTNIIRYLNIKSLHSELPAEFKDVFNIEKYKESQLYTKTKESFSYLSSTVMLALSLSIIFFGLYNILDQYIIQTFNFESDIINGLLFYGALVIITDLITTPFTLYNTFVIEEKFGFNNMSLKMFLSDKIKSYFLIVIIGTPIISLILYFFESFENYAWFYAWALMVLFSIIMQPIFNNLIAPMFNKFEPLEEGPLFDKIKSYLTAIDFPVKKLEVMDGSKRSSHSNAYFSGFGKNKRIALFDTLIDSMDDDEIIAVLAHEVGHYKLKHIQNGMILGAIQSGIMLFILSFFINNTELFEVFKMEHISIYGSLLFFSILYTPISMIMGFVFNYISRKNEFEADNYSLQTTKSPQHLISALKKLTVENLGNLNPHWLNVALNYSHPPVLDRINALKK